ncbi:MAG: hypothetical protein JSR58_04225 [Verrucomicrobia bacterium]|nr:hypothetical protein [Verrucomicrobiota bacterium]
MNKYALIFFSIFVFGFALYSYVDLQNQVTSVKLQLPKVAREIKALQEENTRLQFEIDTFENPDNLLRLATAPTFSHLQHPLSTEVLVVKEGLAVNLEPEKESTASAKSTIRLASSFSQ